MCGEISAGRAHNPVSDVPVQTESEMNELLADIISAHGGMERWNQFANVQVSIVSGGGFFPLKGVIH
jgi:hypothetical protein